MRKVHSLISLGISALLLSGCGVQSVTQCTTEPEDTWLDQETFQSSLTAKGYEISEFKVTEGNCYEIYGHNQAGQKVEIYFNPVDGSIVKEKIE